VVPDLPNDHYHAFADPMVVIIVGLGAGAAWRATVAGGGRVVASAPRVAAAGAVAALCVWNLTTQPPAVNPDGGFPAASVAAARIVASTGAQDVGMESLPAFKSVEAYAYPLVRDGTVVNGDRFPGNLVVICDARFAGAIGAACGGPAEDRLVAMSGHPGLTLADRFEAAPNRIISVYRAAP